MESSVTAEGISLGTEQPYISPYFVKFGSLPGATPDAALATSVAKVDGLILVGTLSAYREIKPDNAAKEYEKYVEAFEMWEAGRPPRRSIH